MRLVVSWRAGIGIYPESTLSIACRAGLLTGLVLNLSYDRVKVGLTVGMGVG